jgi:GTP-binding protein
MALPVVLIAGRPNVGKSTLFNRIVGSRDAIVDDQPGVTRDRKYGHADWSGRDFIVVDSGGYVPESTDQLEQAIVEQVRQGIDEADLIIFLVDVKSGLTAMDEEIARFVKKSGKTAILAINKVDNAERELHTSEFFRLGFAEQVSISAVGGRQIGDFLDVLIQNLPAPKAFEKETPWISIAVIGRPNVGKSSFVNAILGEEKHIVTDIPGTTRDAIDTLFRHYGQDYLLIDTAGLRRKSKVHDPVEFYSTVRSIQSIQKCNVAIMLVEATTGPEAQDLKIIQEAVRLRKGLILAVNKWDLIEKDTHTARQFELDIRDKLKNVAYIPTIFISALTKQRIFKVIEIAKSVHQERFKMIKTSELNRFLEEAVARYAPPSMDRREVKINYCTQIKTGPPVFAFYCNAPDAIRANYRAFLENQLRERFGFLGVPLSLAFRKK